MSDFGALRKGAGPAQPKQMSSRLSNMKFMQRAEASTVRKPYDSPQTPSSDLRVKRRRTGEYSVQLSDPGTPSTVSTPLYDNRVVASGAFPSKTTDIPMTHGTNSFDPTGTETQWTLDAGFPGVNGQTQTGNGVDADGTDEGEYDSDEEDEIWSPSAPSGRQMYGSFKRKKGKSTSANATPGSAAKSSTKHGLEYENDANISPASSGTDSDSHVEDVSDEEPEFPSKNQGKKGKNTSKSAADLKKMDSLNFQKPGFNHGFGRQRTGLAGGGGHGTSKPKKKKKAKKSR